MKSKKQKIFAIVNIFAGVVFTMSSIILMKDPSAGPGGFITLLFGAAFWICGAMVLKKMRKGEIKEGNKLLLINSIFFAISSLFMILSVTLPFIAPYF